MHLHVLAAIAAVALAISASPAAAAQAQALMEQRRALSSGWENTVTDVHMTIRKSNGSSVERLLRQHAIEMENDGNRTINVFTSPKDVDGLAILTHSSLTGDDDQWLYLPSNARVKRISSANRSGAFIGSEFAYEDLSSFEVPKYTYGDVAEGEVNGQPVYIVDSVPSYANSGYAALKSYLDKTTKQPLQIDFFNQRHELYKRLTLGEYQSYTADGAWRPHRLEMANVLNGNVTTLVYDDFVAANKDARAFTANRLPQIR